MQTYWMIFISSWESYNKMWHYATAQKYSVYEIPHVCPQSTPPCKLCYQCKSCDSKSSVLLLWRWCFPSLMQKISRYTRLCNLHSVVIIIHEENLQISFEALDLKGVLSWNFGQLNKLSTAETPSCPTANQIQPEWVD
jgi:hypothetical protein